MNKYVYEEQLKSAAYKDASEFASTPMIVNITETEDGSYQADKTFEEIQNYYLEHKGFIVANFNDYAHIPMTLFEIDNIITFSIISIVQNSLYAIAQPDFQEIYLTISNNNDISFDHKTIEIAFTELTNVHIEEDVSAPNITYAINYLLNNQKDIKNNINNIKQLPSYSTSNENQFLRVINGTPTWATVPNAEEASF